MSKVLIIDDDESMCYGLKRSLGKYHEIFTALDFESAYRMVKSETFSLIFLDYRLGQESGFDVLAKLRDFCPDIPVIMLTAHGTTELILEAIRMGAVDFLTKPVDTQQLLAAIDKYSRIDRYCDDGDRFENLAEVPFAEDAIIASSEGMKEVLKSIAIIAPTDSPVLLTGQSGTGKDVAANLIHRYSRRKNNSFVNINCAAIPDSLLESELFGYVKGAFTGAYASNSGKFQMADKGTIFLDEIGDLPLHLQSKLLQVLQDGRIQRVGDNTTVKVDIRIISATNKNLKELVRNGGFREDLYYRINAFGINVPSLKDRKKDVWPLALHFIIQFAKDTGNSICCIEKSAREVMEHYPWPGNVRELKNAVSKAVAMSRMGAITKDVIAASIGQEKEEPSADCSDLYAHFRAKYSSDLLPNSLEELEKAIITNVLREEANNHTAAAKALGISRVTLYEKIKKYHF